MVLIAVSIVCSDRSVSELCREVIAEYPDTEWDLHITDRGGNAVQRYSDLSLVDFSPEMELPETAAWGRSHFVLLRRKDVQLFRERHPYAAASILLKPVTRPTLRAIVGQVIASKRARGAHQEKSLRVDRDELLQCVIQANLKLQEYDQERTNFLSRAIHDFRAPVTAVGGYCGLLLAEQLGPLTAQQKEVLQRMRNSARRLGRMANAMFQLSVSRQVEQRAAARAGDIRECIEQALHETAQFTDEKRIETFVDMSAPAGTLYFDPSGIEQVLMNLLDNACKFTPRNGWIEIKGYPCFWDRRIPNLNGNVAYDRRTRESQEPNAYRIDIQDSGPGIPPEHLDTMFEEYTSYSRHADRSGAGLGLAICKMIVTHHQGKIWAESRAQGASFSFVLPVPNAETDQAETTLPVRPESQVVLRTA